MFLGKKIRLENYILDILKDGPKETLDLILRIKKQIPGTTKQGVYTALRVLNQEEIIIVSGGEVTLNILWLNRLAEYTRQAKNSYADSETESEYFLRLENGDRAQYYFKNPALLDSFWGHVLVELMRKVKNDPNMFSYNPHYWFLFGRRESELQYLSCFPNYQKKFLLISADKTALDKTVNQDQEKMTDYFQYCMLGKALFEKNNYYFNVIGDYLVEVLIDKMTADEIELFYQKYEALNESRIKEFKGIIERPGKNKFIISKNPQKAARLRKKLVKFFYLTKDWPALT
ncbi:MAG TPA: hypothetical protein PLR18_00390 [bacterium]|nr:hypothetical protein [bacterium]